MIFHLKVSYPCRTILYAIEIIYTRACLVLVGVYEVGSRGRSHSSVVPKDQLGVSSNMGVEVEIRGFLGFS